jgi:hypothetical protein
MSNDELKFLIESEFVAWNALLGRLTEPQLIAPLLAEGRSVKDMLVHATAWNERLLHVIQNVQAGIAVRSLRQPDENWSETLMRVNYSTQQLSQSQTLEQSLTAFRNSYQQVLASVSTLSAAHLAKPTELMMIEEPLSELASYIACEHPAEHRAEIQAALTPPL